MSVTKPTNYQECAARSDSIIQESYPSVCITSSGSRFVETVTQQTPQPNTNGSCVVAGCSGELCVPAGSETTASICVYKASYQCYKTATCEVQSNGACGWTQTTELNRCLTENEKGSSTPGTFCGGIAGMVCPLGFTCQIDGNYPDSGGKCVKQDTSTPTIDSPDRGSTITSPVKVIGSVPPGWMFEGSFPIKIIDSNGKIIVQGVAKERTPGTWMTGKSIPFEATLSFTTTAQSGAIVLQKDNPSGEPKNDASYSLSIAF